MAGESKPLQVSLLTRDHFLECVGPLGVEERSIWIGWTVTRAVALAHAGALDDQVEDALVALAMAVLRIAWTPDDAATAARERGGAQGGIERGRGAQDEGTPGASRRLRVRSKREKDADHESESEPEAEREARGERDSTERSGERLGGASTSAGRRGRHSVHRLGSTPRTPIAPGTRVRVLNGPFAGRAGVVQDLDGKGGARVLLGLLAVRVVVRDLFRGRGPDSRPRLSSSHRRPPPVRS